MRLGLGCILLLLGIYANAQKGTSEVQIQKLDVMDNQLVIEYDITNYEPGQQFDIGLYFLDDNSRSHFPKSLSGDFGSDVPGGESRKVIWDISQDYDELNYVLRPQFIVNGMKRGANMGGPQWAYLSMVLPGMGDYFVVDHKETFIKPYIRTLAYLSFIGLGVKACLERKEVLYMEQVGWEPANPARWWENNYAVDENGNWIPRYEEFSRTETWLFNGDYEVFFAAAATVWLLDVIYVAGKGQKNEAARRNFLERSSLQLGYMNHSTGFKLAYHF